MILAGVLLVLFLLGQVRVGLRGEYTVSGLKVWARLGVLKLRLLPWRKKKPAREKKPLPKPIQKETEKPKTLPGGALDYARELLPLALEAAGQFRRKLRVDYLELEIQAGASWLCQRRPGRILASPDPGLPGEGWQRTGEAGI